MSSAEDNSPQADADYAHAEFAYTVNGESLELKSERIVRDIQRLVIPGLGGKGINLTYYPKRVLEGANEFNLSEMSKVLFAADTFDEYDRNPSGVINITYEIIRSPTEEKAKISGAVLNGKVENKRGDVLTFKGVFNYEFSVPLQ